MCKICQKCGKIAEYNSYYGRITCTSCSWMSPPLSKNESQKSDLYSRYSGKDMPKQQRKKVMA